MVSLRNLLLLFILIIPLTSFAFVSTKTSMHVAGTHNGWSLTATPMALVADNQWQTTITLKATDELKFVPVNWTLSYGDADANGIADTSGTNIKVKTGANTYRVTFNDKTLAYSLVVAAKRPPVANAGPDKIVTVGTSVTLDASLSTAPDGTIVSYAWDNAFTAGKTSTKVMDAVGTYTVKLTVTDSNNLTSTDTVIITVNPKPLPIANAGADKTVTVGSSVTLDGGASTVSDGTITSYVWDNGFGIGKTATKVMDTVGSFSVKLTITDSNHNTATDTVVITVNPKQLPIANAGPDKAVKLGELITLDGGLSSAPDGTITSYVWDNAFGAGKTVSKVMSVVGTFTVKLTVTDSNNNTATDTTILTVSANQAPTVSAGSSQSVPAGQTTILLAGSAGDADGAISSLQWLQVSGTAVTLINPTSASASFNNPGVGIYVFKLTATDNDGASSSSNVTITVNANVVPIANAGVDISATKGQLVTFNGSASSDSDGTISSYSWTSTAFAAPLTGVQPTFTFANAGTFNVVLTVTDNKGATATDTVVVTVADASLKSTYPTMRFVGTHNSWNLTSTPMTLIADNTWRIDITLKATDEFKFVPSSWSLSFGDGDANGIADSGGNIKVKSGANNYRITFNDKTLAYSVVINTKQPPVANAGPDKTVIVGSSVSLDGSLSIAPSGTITSYVWDNGFGSGQTASKVMDTVGTFIVKLTVTDSNNLSATDTTLITVNPKPLPIANAGPDKTVIVGSSITLDGSLSTAPGGTIVSYVWDNGFGSGQTVSKVMDTVGTFTVKLTVTDSNNATATDTLVVTVNPKPLPIANAGPDKTVTVGSSVNLDGSLSAAPGGTIVSYVWDNGFGSGQSVSKMMDIVGTFTVRLTVTDSNDVTATDTVVITVNPKQPPVANAGADKTISVGSSVTLDGSLSTASDGTITSYVWDNAFGSGKVVSKVMDTVGTFTVKLTVTDSNNNTASDTIVITVNPKQPPVANAGPDKAVKVGASVTLDGGASTAPDGTIASYVWDNGFGSGKTVSKVMSAAGIFTVKLTVTDSNNNTATDTTNITVTANQVPIVSAGSNQSVRFDQATITLSGTASDADGSIASLQWAQTSGVAVTLFNSTAATANFSNMGAGIYSFKLTATDNDGASTSSNVIVTILANVVPIANAGSDISTTKNQSVTFNGSASSDSDGTISTYSWTSSAFPSPLTGAQPNFSFASSGTFSVVLTVIDNTGATATDTVVVTVADAPPKSTYPTMRLVGTHNSWNLASTPMTLVADNIWKIDVTLKATDEFKFVPASWALSFGDTDANGIADSTNAANIKVKNGAGAYRIIFNDKTLAYTVALNTSGSPFVTNAKKMYFRGGPFGWEAAGRTPMILVGNYLWELEVNFLSSFPGFKLDFHALNTNSSNWSQGLGDGRGYRLPNLGLNLPQSSKILPDGIMDADTVVNNVEIAYDDIDPPSNGRVLIRYNELTRVYSRTSLASAPIADAGSPQIVKAGSTVTLDGSLSQDLDNDIVSYHWDNGFGEGQFVSRVFDAPGVYTVKLTVTDSNNLSSTDSVVITVTPSNPPVANAGIDQAVKVGSSVTLNGSFSSDPDGDIASYSWDSGFGLGINPSRIMDQVGSFTINLTVEDSNGNTSSDSVVVTVNPNQPPTVNAGSNESVRFDRALVALNGSANDSDGVITAYKWTQTGGPTVVLINSTSTNASFAHNGEGVYSFNLSATDDNGDTGSSVVNITIVGNLSPVANAGADITVFKDELVTFNGSLSVDPDGSISSYKWENSEFSAALTGVRPSAKFSEVGSFPVVLTVTDNDGKTKTDVVKVTVEKVPLKYTHRTMNLVGTFNSWSLGATPMVLVEDFTWQAKVNLFETDKLKFVPEQWNLSYVDTNSDGTAEASGAGNVPGNWTSHAFLDKSEPHIEARSNASGLTPPI